MKFRPAQEEAERVEEPGGIEDTRHSKHRTDTHINSQETEAACAGAAGLCDR